MNAAVAHHYKRLRATTNYTAEAAYASAKRHLHFVARLEADVKESKRRSKAARKGWKTRKAA